MSNFVVTLSAATSELGKNLDLCDAVAGALCDCGDCSKKCLQNVIQNFALGEMSSSHDLIEVVQAVEDTEKMSCVSLL